MTLNPLSLDADLSLADGLETVALRQPGADTTVTIHEALRRSLSGQDGTREAAPSDGVYSRTDVHWVLAARQVPEAPRLGAQVIDSTGVAWTVLLAERSALGSRWVLWCRALALTHGLDQRVDVERAVWIKSPAGAQSASWQTWRTSIAARVQPLEQASVAAHEQRAERTTHRVYLAEALPLDTNCRILHAGEVLNVRSCRLLERIDQLMEIDCERSAWPLGAEGVS